MLREKTVAGATGRMKSGHDGVTGATSHMGNQAAGDAPQFDLRLGDCVAGMKGLAAGSVDVVVTSPPYNLDIRYGAYRDDRDVDEYMAWSLEWATEVRRVLAENGSFFLNIGAAPANPMLPHALAARLSALFVLQNTIHWIKSITVKTREGAEISAGHFKPINSRRFITDCHEYIFHFTKTGAVPLDRLAVGVPYSDKSNIGRWGHTGGRDLRCRGNNWFIPYETIQSRAEERPHPATFPVALAAQCVRLHGVRSGLVMLDPFLGIGNSALAAAECGVGRFIGFEIDEGYLKECRGRVEEDVKDLRLAEKRLARPAREYSAEEVQRELGLQG